MKKMIAVACVLAAGLPALAIAQFAKPEDAIHYRQSALTVMSTHFGRIGAVVKGEKPFDAADVQANAVIVETMAKLPWSAFGAGTESGGNTKAKPEIWKEKAEFDTKAKNLQEATIKLTAAAKSGDEGAVKAAFGTVGQSCKACHDSYRNR